MFLTNDNLRMSRGEERRKIRSHSSIERASKNNGGLLEADMSSWVNIVGSDSCWTWLEPGRNASAVRLNAVDRLIDDQSHLILLGPHPIGSSLKHLPSTSPTATGFPFQEYQGPYLRSLKFLDDYHFVTYDFSVGVQVQRIQPCCSCAWNRRHSILRLLVDGPAERKRVNCGTSPDRRSLLHHSTRTSPNTSQPLVEPQKGSYLTKVENS